MRTIRSSFIVVAATALVLLTGCTSSAPATSEAAPSASAAAPATDQSKTEACTIIQEQLTAFGESAGALSTSDPQAALAAFTDLTAQTNAELSAITNADVKPAADKAVGALNDYVAYLGTVVSDPSKASELGTRITTLQQSFTDAATVCAS